MSTATLAGKVEPRVAKAGLNVVLFSGGSGTRTISELLVSHPQVSLSIAINCYDDGHSTGRLRRFVPGMLGPSDVRKNIARLMPKGDRCYDALRLLSDHRLPVGVKRDHASRIVTGIARQQLSALPPELADAWQHLAFRHATGLSGYAASFLEFEERASAAGREFDYTDCALGNLFFVGCYEQSGCNFNDAVAAFGSFYEARARVLNVTLGENLFIVAEKEDGGFFVNEADLVASPAKIRQIALINESEALNLERSADLSASEIRKRIEAATVTPQINPEVAQALGDADVIIYGPGTQHSSLLPSYLTKDVGARIAANQRADKIFIANIRRDVDIQANSANDLAAKLLDCMRRGSGPKIEWRDCVTHFFVQRPSADRNQGPEYVPFDGSSFNYSLDTVWARDWEAGEGQHEGGYVFSELQSIVQSRIEIDLAPRPFLVSLIVPALNEQATVEQTLKRLMALDFSRLELGKEVLLVDGGSTDRTVELAQSVRGVKVVQLPAGSGRGAALRQGVSECRGNYVVFFAADDEYNPDDLLAIVGHLRQGTYQAVFGTRSTKVLDLSTHLKNIYEGNRLLYLVSKYGGLTISILTLILYNRFISDVLTACKGFDTKTLRGLALESDGVELEAEIVAKLCKSQKYILEVPVDFRARTRAAGKKIRVFDGVKTLWALVRGRFQ